MATKLFDLWYCQVGQRCSELVDCERSQLQSMPSDFIAFDEDDFVYREQGELGTLLAIKQEKCALVFAGQRKAILKLYNKAGFRECYGWEDGTIEDIIESRFLDDLDSALTMDFGDEATAFVVAGKAESDLGSSPFLLVASRHMSFDSIPAPMRLIDDVLETTPKDSAMGSDLGYSGFVSLGLYRLSLEAEKIDRLMSLYQQHGWWTRNLARKRIARLELIRDLGRCLLEASKKACAGTERDTTNPILNGFEPGITALWSCCDEVLLEKISLIYDRWQEAALKIGHGDLYERLNELEFNRCKPGDAFIAHYGIAEDCEEVLGALGIMGIDIVTDGLAGYLMHSNTALEVVYVDGSAEQMSASQLALRVCLAGFRPDLSKEATRHSKLDNRLLQQYENAARNLAQGPEPIEGDGQGFPRSFDSVPEAPLECRLDVDDGAGGGGKRFNRYGNGSYQHEQMLQYPVKAGMRIDWNSTMKEFISASSQAMARSDSENARWGHSDGFAVLEDIDAALADLQHQILVSGLSKLLTFIAFAEGEGEDKKLELGIADLIASMRGSLKSLEDNPIAYKEDGAQDKGVVADHASVEALNRIRDEFSALCRIVGIDTPVQIIEDDDYTPTGKCVRLHRGCYATTDVYDCELPPTRIDLKTDKALYAVPGIIREHVLKACLIEMVKDEKNLHEHFPENWPSPEMVAEKYGRANLTGVFLFPRGSLMSICKECGKGQAYSPLTGAYGDLPIGSNPACSCGGSLEVHLASTPIYQVGGRLYVEHPIGALAAITARNIGGFSALDLGSLYGEERISSMRDVVKAVYGSMGGMSLEEAWSYLARHPLYRGAFPDSIDFDVMAVCPETGSIEESGFRKNTQREVWIEGAAGYHYEANGFDGFDEGKDRFIGVDDFDLWLGGTTLEEGVITLASVLRHRAE